MSQRQCLPIDDDSSESEQEFDLSKMSAIDYLKQVRYERKKLPPIVTVHPMTTNQDEEEPVENGIAEKSYNPNDPTEQWREIQTEKFSQMQQRIIELRKVPGLESRLANSYKFDTSGDDDCINFCKDNDPVLSVILTLNQGQLEELIEILSGHLSDTITAPEFPQQISSLDWITKWVYALLACLRSPLDPEVHSCLRMIAKSCIQVTDNLKSLPDSNEDSFLPWNLIIVIIAISFHQYDLLNL